ncbi:unnamed protein product [Toxocara canis]|uniref:Uncharacterized protein n=1 Tax=Toxocara canis TaxID=6265 RepID=A0A183UZ88_TOXCA|nr:unnamed protein product [Toxocara canis]
MCLISFNKIRERLMKPTKIYRSSHSYPYPRTHSLVVVPSTRPPASEEEEPNRSMIIPKQRPPLNRAIPTIPESKSNESIVTQSSERRDDYIADGAPSSSRHHEIRAQHCSSSSTFNKVDLKARKSSLEDRSVVIENKLAQNLSAKTGMSVTTKNECACETPKSPLMSVAHSVRTRLTKLSNRFSRVDPRQGIRSSYSLSRSVFSHGKLVLFYLFTAFK